MTKLEEKFAKMTPAQRKKANAEIGAMMGMKPGKTTGKAKSKSKGK